MSFKLKISDARCARRTLIKYQSHLSGGIGTFAFVLIQFTFNYSHNFTPAGIYFQLLAVDVLEFLRWSVFCFVFTNMKTRLVEAQIDSFIFRDHILLGAPIF